MKLLENASRSLISGDAVEVNNLIRKSIKEELPVKQILDEGLISGMKVVGEKFKNQEIFLPEVLMAARAMYAGLELLQPLLIGENIPSLGKVVLGTVQGDMHDLGKNLVGIMLKGAGFEVIDIGKDVAPEKFIELAAEKGSEVIGMWAVLSTTPKSIIPVIELLRAKGLQSKIKTIVGGPPITVEWAKDIGADAYASDATESVDRIKELLGIS